MKKKDLQTLREKNIDELTKIVDKKKVEFNKAQAKITTANEKNLKKPKNLRHEISQILSIIRERELMENFALKEKESTKKE